MSKSVEKSVENSIPVYKNDTSGNRLRCTKMHRPYQNKRIIVGSTKITKLILM